MRCSVAIAGIRVRIRRAASTPDGPTRGDRLSATDASFLAQESDSAHMHLGGAAVFAGPSPGYERVVRHIASRLHLVPRYRQKLAFPPLDSGRPMWADDSRFEVEYHVRHAALPAPGDDGQLAQLAARIHSQPLDRTRPLWEMSLVEGLEGGRFALVVKAHHALVDGIGGVDLVSVLFDLSADPGEAPIDSQAEDAGIPRSRPGAARRAARAAGGLVRAPVKVGAGAAGAVLRPRRTLAASRVAAEGLGEVAWAVLNPAPATPFNVPIGPHRRVAFTSCPLADFKSIKSTFGGTVNDVLLAVVCGGLRTLLQSRGVRTDGLELRALIPVSIRTEDERHAMGNRIVAMRAPLPLYLSDPVARLRLVKQSMDGLKQSKQAFGAEILARLEHFAPPAVLAQASRLNFTTRLFNLLVTNVPGPQFPLYLLGRRLEHLFPIAFLAKDHALSVAIMSYDGGVDFGVLGDYEQMADVEIVAEGIRDSLNELLGAARREEAQRKSGGVGQETPALSAAQR